MMENETGRALAGAPTGESDLACGSISSINTLNTNEIQARRLSRLYALGFETATTIASLCYGVAR